MKKYVHTLQCVFEVCQILKSSDNNYLVLTSRDYLDKREVVWSVVINNFVIYACTVGLKTFFLFYISLYDRLYFTTVIAQTAC